jgi:hypothetical protein
VPAHVTPSYEAGDTALKVLMNRQRSEEFQARLDQVKAFLVKCETLLLVITGEKAKELTR